MYLMNPVVDDQKRVGCLVDLDASSLERFWGAHNVSKQDHLSVAKLRYHGSSRCYVYHKRKHPEED